MNPFALPSGQFSGDTFPIFRDGVWHLFHMMPPVIAHHVSRDLLQWEAWPTAVTPGAAGEPDSGGVATGCVVEHAGRYYHFYTGNQQICLTLSDDLAQWTKYAGNPVARSDGDIYGSDNFRDPFVFRYEPESCWWMLFGAQTRGVSAQRAGCVGLAKSPDLLHWKLHPPLWAPHIGPHADCPQLMQHLNRWWLCYLQRNTRYRVAVSPSGPFRRPATRNLGTSLLAAASRPVWDGRRWVVLPFVMRLQNDDDEGAWEYGGPLAIPRQLDFHVDCTITERPVEEMLAQIRALPEPGDAYTGTQPLTGSWTRAGQRTESTHPDGGTLLLPALPADLYLEFTLAIADLDSDFHLLLRTSPDLLRGYQLSLHPSTAQVSLRSISQWDTDRVLASRSVALTAKKPITVRVFLCGSICEVFLDDRCSLTARLYRWRDGIHGLEFRDGTGSITNLAWRPFTM